MAGHLQDAEEADAEEFFWDRLHEAFSTSRLFQQLSKPERCRLQHELDVGLCWYQHYEMTDDVKPGTTKSQLGLLDTLQVSFGRIAKLRSTETKNTSQAVKALLIEAALKWAESQVEEGTCGGLLSPEEERGEAIAFVEGLFEHAAAAAEIARRASQMAHARQKVEAANPTLSRIERMVSDHLPRTYEEFFGVGTFKAWFDGQKASPGLEFVSDALEYMDIHPYDGAGRYPFDTLKSFHRNGTGKLRGLAAFKNSSGQP